MVPLMRRRQVSTASTAFFLCLAAGIAWAERADAASCTKPNILVVLDVSGSMNATVNGSTKYSQAVNGLDSALTTLETKANFGLLLFPSPKDQGYSVSDLCNIAANQVEL